MTQYCLNIIHVCNTMHKAVIVLVAKAHTGDTPIYLTEYKKKQKYQHRHPLLFM